MKIGKQNLKILTLIVAFVMAVLLLATPYSISAEDSVEKHLPISVKKYQKEIQIELLFWQS